MDFLNFFGLKEDPFKLTPDPAYFYPSSSHNEGLLLMDYSIEQKEGFFLVIGDPGTGKTTLLNVFLEKWKSGAEIAMILTPRLSPEEFLISVIEDLNINLENKNKNEIIKALRDFMIKKSSEDKRIVIVVDEAQNLPDETLEELRLLSNLETDKDKLLQIILIGQPELESRLVTDRLRQLDQRITTRIHLQHFTAEETMDYINSRLIKAGKKNLKIHKGAKRLIHKLSKGTPRLINMLMSRALMAAYLEESHFLTPRHLHHAVKSLSHSDIKLQKQNKLLLASLGSLSILLLTVAGYIYFQHVSTGGYLKTMAASQEINKSINKAPEPVASQNDRISATNATKGSYQDTNNEKIINKYKFISVKVDGADIRDMPSVSSEEVGWTSKGSSFVVLKEVADSRNIKWYQILHRGKKRWISEELVDVTNQDKP